MPLLACMLLGFKQSRLTGGCLPQKKAGRWLRKFTVYFISRTSQKLWFTPILISEKVCRSYILISLLSVLQWYQPSVLYGVAGRKVRKELEKQWLNYGERRIRIFLWIVQYARQPRYPVHINLQPMSIGQTVPHYHVCVVWVCRSLGKKDTLIPTPKTQAGSHPFRSCRLSKGGCQVQQEAGLSLW